jgi:hypothetical protein
VYTLSTVATYIFGAVTVTARERLWFTVTCEYSIKKPREEVPRKKHDDAGDNRVKGSHFGVSNIQRFFTVDGCT